MMSNLKKPPAEIFAPGEYLRDELQARRWTQADLARILNRPLQVVNEIINGKKRITGETAKELGEAFGTSAQLWMGMESLYRLATAKAPDPAIRRRAREIARRKSRVG